VSRLRIRTLKPEFFADERVGGVSIPARYLMIGLICIADDEGRVKAGAIPLAGHLLPTDAAAIRKIPGWLDELAETGLIVLYEHGGHKYAAIRNWAKHQRINRPTPSDLPPPPDAEVVAQNAIAGGHAPARRRGIPEAVRRAVARREGAIPGEVVDAKCAYCSFVGRIHWRRLASGKPGSWVTFEGLELDHGEPVCSGGESTEQNLVLACSRCNKSKGSKPVADGVAGFRDQGLRDPVLTPSRVGARSAPFRSVPKVEVKDLRQQPNFTRERVDEAVSILSAVARWQVDEIGVENAAATEPKADLLRACHLAVSWGSDPGWQMGPAATLRSALRKLDAEKPKVDERQDRRQRGAEALRSLMANAEDAT